MRNARFSKFTECLANLRKPEGTEVVIEMGIDIAINRRNIVRHALDKGCGWVFFVDDDMVFRPDHLERLLAHDVDVVASLYLNRVPPFYSVAYGMRVDGGGLPPKWIPVVLSDAPREGLAKVVAAGTGGMLVKTGVFRKIEELEDGYVWFLQHGTSDDIAFCDRVIAAGFDIWLDISATMGHITLVEVWPEYADDQWLAGLRLTDEQVLHVKMGD